MLCFSDFILALSPWSYCRLNEPNGISCYNDLTGNKNHLFTVNKEQFAENLTETNFIGDPGISSITPLEENRCWAIDKIPEIPNTALCFTVPEFKSDTHIYRDRN